MGAKMSTKDNANTPDLSHLSELPLNMQHSLFDIPATWENPANKNIMFLSENARFAFHFCNNLLLPTQKISPLTLFSKNTYSNLVTALKKYHTTQKNKSIELNI